MGSGQSSTEEGGFRVFKVTPGSPACEAGLEVFFDFIMEIGGTKLDSDQMLFFEKIQAAENVSTPVTVYNIRTHRSRQVHVLPRKWGGTGLLGAIVRYDTLDNVDSQGIRVLDVFPDSPAQQAGLVPYKDFLLGTTEVMFRDMDELIEVVHLSLGREMKIYVFNSDAERIREATLVPRTGWGGSGSIGADIRTGLLHRIPPPRRRLQAALTEPPAPLTQPALYPEPSVPASSTASAAGSVPAQVQAPLSSDIQVLHPAAPAALAPVVEAAPASLQGVETAEAPAAAPPASAAILQAEGAASGLHPPLATEVPAVV